MRLAIYWAILAGLMSFFAGCAELPVREGVTVAAQNLAPAEPHEHQHLMHTGRADSEGL